MLTLRSMQYEMGRKEQGEAVVALKGAYLPSCKGPAAFGPAADSFSSPKHSPNIHGVSAESSRGRQVV